MRRDRITAAEQAAWSVLSVPLAEPFGKFKKPLFFLVLDSLEGAVLVCTLSPLYLRGSRLPVQKPRKGSGVCVGREWVVCGACVCRKVWHPPLPLATCVHPSSHLEVETQLRQKLSLVSSALARGHPWADLPLGHKVGTQADIWPPLGAGVEDGGCGGGWEKLGPATRTQAPVLQSRGGSEGLAAKSGTQFSTPANAPKSSKPPHPHPRLTAPPRGCHLHRWWEVLAG